MERADDAAIWDFAREQGYVIVSKDGDFHQMSFLRGAPPKVVWVRLGNCSTGEIRELLLSSADRLAAFGSDEEAAFMTLP